MTPVFKIKRAYEPPEKRDGFRILVDRIWPRGLKKESAALDEWAKELAPSTDLRKWWNHNPETWNEFQEKYRKELEQNEAIQSFVSKHGDLKVVSLIFAAKDVLHNHAIVLQDFLNEYFKQGKKIAR